MVSTQSPRTDVPGMNRPDGTIDAAAAFEPYRGPWNERVAGHFLRRAGFGSSARELRRLSAMPLDAVVDEMVNAPNDSAVPAPEDVPGSPSDLPGRKGSTDRRNALKAFRKEERRAIVALQQWWLDRMLTSAAPLHEKMTLFFHGHFTTAALQKGVSPAMMYRQNALFRENALGNLRELTWKVSTDPAMLLYLDNASNVARRPNENYARELMELFTLGVDRYSENDVREAARAWSGWVVDRRSGNARFVPRRHDGGMKTIFGQTGNWSGRDVVDAIFRQPSCSAFFGASLLNFFVYDDPEPQLVEALAALIRKHDYSLKPVMAVLLRSSVFFSERAYRALVKSPAEFAIGAHKTLALDRVDGQTPRAMRQMGQTLFFPPNVAGWPAGANWLTSQTLIARENFIAGLVRRRAGSVAQTQHLSADPQQEAADLISSILQGDASTAARTDVAAYLRSTRSVAEAVYLTMAMPAYELN